MTYSFNEKMKRDLECDEEFSVTITDIKTVLKEGSLFITSL